MDDFKPKKGKALMRAATQVLYDQSDKAIEALALAFPQAEPPLRLLQASFGLRLAYKQERLNQFTEFLMNNPDVFTKELLSSDDFQEGLLVFMDSYLKLRGRKKLDLAQKIFYDFTSSANMPMYPLERYDDTLEKISDAGIRFLGFVHEKIPVVKEKYLEDKMYQNNNTLKDGQTIDDWRKIYVDREPLKTFVEEYLKQEVQRRMKGYSGEEPLTEQDRISDDIRLNLNLVISELEQLGLMKRYTRTTQGWDATSSEEYNLTDYGKKFMSIIKPDFAD